VGVAGPAFAHDCFNPNKKPGAGSIGTITLDAQGNDVSADITKAHGGFITIDASAVGVPGVTTIDFHTAGNNPHGVVGGPGSQKAEHACDGRGIDYADACFPGAEG
jgi:hypothetical protein